MAVLTETNAHSLSLVPIAVFTKYRAIPPGFLSSVSGPRTCGVSVIGR